MEKHEKEITITRALVELKNIDKRIQSAISKGVFVTYKGENVEPKQGIEKAASQYQSIVDLLDRRVRLKSAIVTSNATTKVRICGKEMTIAEAIETKSSIKNYRVFLEELEEQYGSSVRSVETKNAHVRAELDRILRESKDTTGKLKEGYYETNSVKLFDPISVTKKIEDLRKYITEFESDVDATLSESNATTVVIV